MKIAAPVPAVPVPVHQFRALGCSDWYDGHPDRTINGPYETRTLYTHPTTPAPAVPDGWVLVPVEPTQKMLDAMERQWACGAYRDMSRREYRAMIAAAPVPAVQSAARAIAALKEKK
jgi:hypothetical protein